MNVFDWILNFAAVLLWIDWRSGRAVAHSKAPPVISLASSIRDTERRVLRGWSSMGLLAGLLLLRPFFYHSVGGSLGWVPRTDLLAISIPWRSDMLALMFVYSFASFACALGIYLSWLLLVSAAQGRGAGEDSVERFVRLQLGFLDRLPAAVKILLPLAGAALAWAAAVPVLAYFKLLPENDNGAFLWKQAGLFAIAAILLWRWLLVGLFCAHLLNLYVYLGSHPFWPYASRVAQRLLRPFFFLRFAKIDLSPIAGIALVLIVSEFLIEPFVSRAFQRLPL